MGFNGFLVTDWEAIDQIDKNDFYKSVVASINAGIDMNMVPFKYQRYIDTLTQAVNNGDVSQERIDDAVRRILRVKIMMGVFEQPFCDEPLSVMGCEAHRALAREAVSQSLTLLKNEAALPFSKESSGLLVAGAHAHDVGLQCGGWTIHWMGAPGAITPGTTILEGIQAVAGDTAEIAYDSAGQFGETRAPLGFVVVGEEPYAEGYSIHVLRTYFREPKRHGSTF